MNSIRKSTRLAALLARILVTNPRRLRHVLGTALSAAEQVADPEADLASFPVVQPEDLLPGENLERAVLALFPKTLASVSVLEFVCLILLARKLRAKNVFEFGTYKGVSITQLALNLPEGSRILTLDLPEDSAGVRLTIQDPEELKIALEKGKGVLVPQDLRSRIEFVRQDSAVFDAASLAGQMDFVFVDGAHSADYVKNDSQKGWQMLRSGGMIAWHDCRLADPAVVRYLLASPYRPSLISCTSLAFAIKP